MAYESVILVDENDNMIGTMEKMAAHKSAKLHRAISVFVFNNSGKMLLQQRALHKYHSGGKWSNACCSHPRPGEQAIDAAKRRLREEMGLDCDLKHVFNFIYHTELSNGLFEHEYDHVFLGFSDADPYADSREIAEFIYLSPEDIKSTMMQRPEIFTSWFRICFQRVIDQLNLFKND